MGNESVVKHSVDEIGLNSIPIPIPSAQKTRPALRPRFPGVVVYSIPGNFLFC
jgi:hypothetical protein